MWDSRVFGGKAGHEVGGQEALFVGAGAFDEGLAPALLAEGHHADLVSRDFGEFDGRREGVGGGWEGVGGLGRGEVDQTRAGLVLVDLGVGDIVVATRRRQRPRSLHLPYQPSIVILPRLHSKHKGLLPTLPLLHSPASLHSPVHWLHQLCKHTSWQLSAHRLGPGGEQGFLGVGAGVQDLVELLEGLELLFAGLAGSGVGVVSQTDH